MNTPARRVAPLKSTPRYVRPMTGWYKRNPFYVTYMVREATCVFVGYFAMLLLCGLERLSAGEAAFTHFISRLASPGWVVFHLIVLAAFVYHAWTWFAILPKTVPFVYLGGKRVADPNLVRAGAAAAVAVSVVIFIAFKWVSP